jgi:hypothetical protein
MIVRWEKFDVHNASVAATPLQPAMQRDGMGWARLDYLDQEIGASKTTRREMNQKR